MSAILRALALVGLCTVLAAAQPTPPLPIPAVAGWGIAVDLQFGGLDRWVAVSRLNQVQIFDAATGEVIRVVEFSGVRRDEALGPFAGLVMAADPVADRIVLLAYDMAVVAVDVRTGEHLWRSTLPEGTVRASPSPYAPPRLQFSADGQWVLVAGAYAEGGGGKPRTRPVRLRASDGRLDTGVVASTPGEVGVWRPAVWSDDGRWLHVQAGRRTQIVEADSGRVVGLAPSDVVASHSASGVVVTRDTFEMRIVDLRSGKRLKDWHVLQYGGAAFSRDGSQILLSGALGWCVLDSATLAQIAVAPRDLPSSTRWAWSGDGRRLAGVQGTRLVRVELGPSPSFAALGAGSATLLTVADEAWMRHVDFDEMSGLSETATRAARRMLKEGQYYQPRRYAVDMDGRLPQRERVRAIQASAPAQAAAAMTPDGRWLAVRASDGQVDVWDVAVGNRAPFRLPPTRCRIGQITVGYHATEEAGTARLEAETRVMEKRLTKYDAWGLATLQESLETLDGCPTDPALLLPGQAPPPGPPDAVVFQPLHDGRLAIRRGDRIVGHLVVFGAGDWLVTTPAGLFDGSPNGWRQLRWGAEGLDTVSGEAYLREFYQPGLLADLIAGRPLRAVAHIADRDRRRPTLTVELLRAEDEAVWVRVHIAEGRSVPTRKDASPGGGVRDLRVLRNGRLVHAVRGEIRLAADGTAAADVRVRMQPGENRVVAYAFNRDDIKGDDAELEVSLAQTPQPGVTYVLAVGINRYANAQFNLRFAVPDAVFFGEQVASHQRALGNDVALVTLTDFDASRANIQLALDRLAGRSTEPLPQEAPSALARLRPARPNDAVVVYFAGHGMADGDRFHLIPSDIAYAGRREDVGVAIPQLLTRTISDSDLERSFDAIDAQHLLLVIDACQSGQALELADARPGPMNSRGLAQLAYDKGMSILTASQAHEAALESARLGHGYLTFALVNEGLGQMAADRLPADGRLTADEWFAYAVTRVPELQAEAMSDAARSGRVLRFELTGRVQTPRVFARRDATGAAWVVAGRSVASVGRTGPSGRQAGVSDTSSPSDRVDGAIQRR